MARLTLPTNCHCCSLPRRGFLAAFGAGVALGATAFATPVLAQAPAASASAPAAKPFRIDVHHHLASPAWVAALKRARIDSPPVNNWTPERSLADMDRGGIATAILSVTQPAMSFLPAAEAAAICRDSNEFGRGLMDAHPGRFGLFAVLPMPHVEQSLAEIAYAMDILGADGIGLLTSYGDKYLGDPAFAPVMAELNRRKLTVYTHPADPSCCVNLGHVPPSSADYDSARSLGGAGLTNSAVEYQTDTTRTIGSLIFTGTAASTPDINWIFSHGGGTVTSVTERFTIQMLSTPQYKSFTADGVYAQLKRFFYDTAQVANPIAMGGLTKLVASSQILFGSDYPYRTSLEQTLGLGAVFGADDLKLIERGNAQRLLKRLATL